MLQYNSRCLFVFSLFSFLLLKENYYVYIIMDVEHHVWVVMNSYIDIESVICLFTRWHKL